MNSVGFIQLSNVPAIHILNKVSKIANLNINKNGLMFLMSTISQISERSGAILSLIAKKKTKTRETMIGQYRLGTR